ncbi:MAG TPA: hypothetical protein VF442_08105, partial [Sphingobium sp.]
MPTDEQRQQLADEGFYVARSALTGDELERARSALEHAVAAGRGTSDPRLDPNDANIRLYNLP